MKRPVLVTLLLLFSCASASAQLTKITVGYGSISAAQLPVWIGKEAGIFSKNGLDVQLVFFKGSTTAVMALISKETPISQVTGPPIVNAVLRGSDAVLLPVER
jgi:ABC-type nitrate/sulfonate/bicarbonate transport system substrate-binding protein